MLTCRSLSAVSHTIPSLPLGRNTEFIALLQDGDGASGGRVSQIVRVSDEQGGGRDCLANRPNYLDFVRATHRQSRRPFHDSADASACLRSSADILRRPDAADRVPAAEDRLGCKRDGAHRHHRCVVNIISLSSQISER